MPIKRFYNRNESLKIIAYTKNKYNLYKRVYTLRNMPIIKNKSNSLSHFGREFVKISLKKHYEIIKRYSNQVLKEAK